LEPGAETGGKAIFLVIAAFSWPLEKKEKNNDEIIVIKLCLITLRNIALKWLMCYTCILDRYLHLLKCTQ